MQPCEREPGLRLDPDEVEVPQVRSVADRGLQQRRLADAGLAAEHHRTAQAVPAWRRRAARARARSLSAAHQRRSLHRHMMLPTPADYAFHRMRRDGQRRDDRWTTRRPSGRPHDHRPRHHRPRPRLLGDPAELGGLDRPLRGQGLHRHRPRVPGLRGRGRGAERRPDADRRATGAGHHRALRGGDLGARPPPIIMGHSAGGAFTQILLDHGFGAAGVAINSAPTEGVQVVPPSQLKATFPVLKNPANHHKAVGFSFEQWNYAFTNGFPEERARELYERYHIPASGRILWDSVLANFEPGHQDTWVDYHNDDRAPLLFVSGSTDHLMPPAIQQSNLKHYKSDTITEIKEFEGPHLLPSQDGWEEVADHALEWALAHADAGTHRRVSEPGGPGTVALTHIGGPTMLIEVDGWRILTDPTFDPPGRTYHFGLGTVVDQGDRPGDRGRRARTDRRGAAHPRPPRRQPRRRRPRAPARRGGRGHDRVGRRPARRRPGRPGPGARRRGRRPGSKQPGRPTIAITATPCRHGPPLSRAARRRRGRLRARVGGPATTACCGSRATPCSTTACREVAERFDVERRDPAPRRGAVRRHRAGPLHDGRRARARALSRRCARAPSSRCTTRAGRTSARARTGSKPRWRLPNLPCGMRSTCSRPASRPTSRCSPRPASRPR